ncbi:unnamed protein product [Ilex paraguariensis]|uniref:Uncharacterized protein n=1 Tax=Ilex paraguariensis TaxID=185542 RepID=A0ABC8TZI5_9AQUA
MLWVGGNSQPHGAYWFGGVHILIGNCAPAFSEPQSRLILYEVEVELVEYFPQFVLQVEPCDIENHGLFTGRAPRGWSEAHIRRDDELGWNDNSYGLTIKRARLEEDDVKSIFIEMMNSVGL